MTRPTTDIDTPALVLDLDAMERNLARMARFAAERGLRLRPHAKMHKSAEIARMQVAAGAVGVCVQKTAEAEALAAGGMDDILITNEVVAPAKLARVAALARQLQARGGRLGIAVDSPQGVAALAAACAAGEPGGGACIDVYIEVDVGHGRCGVPPGEPALALARQVATHAALRLTGLQAYPGGAQHLRAADARAQAIARAAEAVALTRHRIEAAGLGPLRVTGAGTGTFAHEAASGAWHELQAGSYLFMDADYAANDDAPAFEHALFVQAQVISRQGDRAVCDAGHKSHAIDSGLPRVAWPEGLAFANGGDEHGVLRAAQAGARLPEIGETVWLIPGHCDPTVNLHGQLLGVRGGLRSGWVERSIRVDARGALS